MISSILNNKTVWYFLILASYSAGSGYTRKEIKELTKLDNLSIDNILKKLLFNKIILKDKRIIKLNFNNSETQQILEIINQEKKRLNHPAYELFMILTEFIHLIESYDIDMIYLFGSHAKKTASQNSDIDLAVFSSKNIDLINTEEKIETKFDKELQIHYFKTEQIKSKDKIIANILKDGVKII